MAWRRPHSSSISKNQTGLLLLVGGSEGIDEAHRTGTSAVRKLLELLIPDAAEVFEGCPVGGQGVTADVEAENLLLHVFPLGLGKGQVLCVPSLPRQLPARRVGKGYLRLAVVLAFCRKLLRFFEQPQPVGLPIQQGVQETAFDKFLQRESFSTSVRR